MSYERLCADRRGSRRLRVFFVRLFTKVGRKCEWREEDRFDGAVAMVAVVVVNRGEIVIDERLVLKVVVTRSKPCRFGL